MDGLRRVLAVWLCFILIGSSTIALSSADVVMGDSSGIKNSTATIHYVGGSGPGNYTIVQDAINASSYGDTVYVYYGVYQESLTLKNGISLFGEMPNRPILEGNNLTVGPEGRQILTAAIDVYIKGFHFRGGDRVMLNPGCINITFSCNIFSNQAWASIHNWNGGSCLIENNIFKTISYAVYSVRGSGGTIPSNDTIVNNVFDDCSTAIYGNTGIQSIYNNIIINGGVGIGIANHPETRIDNNLVANNSNNYVVTTPGTNDLIDIDPQFIDSEYHIDRKSPAYNNGSLLLFSSTDFDGQERPYGIIPDIGIDECGYYISHTPIRINSNADFNQAHGVVNWDTGNGTEWNPWIIEGWEINGTGYSYCIFIFNTTEHFIIRDCNLHHATGTYEWPYRPNEAIRLSNMNSGEIYRCIIHSCDRSGIHVGGWYGAQPVEIHNNTISDNPRGIDLQSGFTRISNNSIAWNEMGILVSGIYNDIEDNDINNNSYGIRLEGGYDNNIQRNKIHYNDIDGVYVNSDSVTFLENKYFNNNYGIFLLSSRSNHIFKNNHFWGDSIYSVGVGTANNLIVHNNTFESFGSGIILGTSTGTKISNNKLTAGSGIVLGDSFQHGEVFNNNITSCTYGIKLSKSNFNILKNNTIMSNWNGLSIDSYSEYNTIYRNYIINNFNQTFNYDFENNSLDAGYPVGGNYWSDYAGIDLFSGPSQDIPGSDGIGDTPPYVVDADSQDNYPLMAPWEPSSVKNIDSGEDFYSIQTAIDDLETVNGHTIEVSSGLYYENIEIDKSLVIRGEDKYYTVINGNNLNDVVRIVANEVTFSGFTITDSGTGADDAAVVLGTVSNCIISDNICEKSRNGIYLTYEYEKQITDNIYTEYSPKINDKRDITWYGYDSDSNQDIYFWNGTIHQITHDSNLDDQVQINNNGELCWEKTWGLSDNIHYWDGHTIKQLSANSVNRNPQINANGEICWTNDDGNDYEIYYYNGLSSTKITNNAYSDSSPQINNKGELCWIGNKEIFYFNGTSATMVTDNSATKLAPQINDKSQICWSEYDGSDYETYLWNGTSIIQITDNSWNDLGPQINNNGELCWAGNSIIYHWNGTTPNIISIEPDPSSSPLINDNGDICWTQGPEPYEEEVFYWDGTAVTQITENSNWDTWLDMNNHGDICWGSMNGLYGSEIYCWTVANNSNISIIDNEIRNNSYGLKIEKSDGAYVYHNSFVNNTVQATDYGNNTHWNNGYPSGGNYWSDYAIGDIYSGPNQDILGFDYIGDLPYNISGSANSSDSYPLMPFNSQPPIIQLHSPNNGSTIQAGVIIQFNISDRSNDITEVFVSINFGSNQTFVEPYELDTTGWLDGIYTLDIGAIDDDNNTANETFFFILDSTVPDVILISPVNNSVLQPGYIIDFEIAELNLASSIVSINSGTFSNFSVPYDIDTTGWLDDKYFINITTVDFASNNAFDSFAFIIDSLFPTITLISPANNSVFVDGVTLDFNVSDSNLDIVNYSINGNVNSSFSPQYNLNTTGWPDGPYAIVIHAMDYAGNFVSRRYNFIIDSSEPIILLNSLANNSVILPGTSINCTVIDDNINIVQYSVNGGAYLPLSSPWDINTAAWADGMYNITVTATDNASNNAVAFFIFTLDSTLPTIILDSPANNSCIVAGTPLHFVISDANPDSAFYSVNGGTNVSLPGPSGIDTTGWPDGTYQISVYAIDIVGNNATRWYSFTIDSTDPDIQLISPANGSVIKAGTVLEFHITEDNIGSVLYSVNGGVSQPFITTYNVSSTGWLDGFCTVRVTAVDNASNMASRVYEFTLDSTAPNIALLAPANFSVVKPGTLIDFSISDPHLVAVNYSLNGAPTIPLTSPFDIDTSAWPDAGYSVRVYAVDSVGNSVSRVFGFIIDSTPPTIQLIFPINNTIMLPGPTIDLSVVDINIYSVHYSVNGGAAQTLAAPFDISTTGWADGQYTILVTAIDRAGNSEAEVFVFTIDSTPPSISLNSPANGTCFNAGAILDFIVTDAHLGAVNFSVNGGIPNPFTTPYDISTTGWADGTYTVQISAVDTVGNSAVRSFVFIVDSTAPEVDAGLDVIQNGQFTQNATVTDAPNGTLTYEWTQISGPGTITFGTPNAEDTTVQANADGNYVIRLNVTDLAGNWAWDEFNLTWDATGPDSTLTFGSPCYEESGGWHYITVDTSITINSTDPADVIQYRITVTWYDIDGWGPFESELLNWTVYQGTFNMADYWTEGMFDYCDYVVAIEYFSTDTLGNNGSINIIGFNIDEHAPTTSILKDYVIWHPLVTNSYANSSTIITLISGDDASGVNATYYSLWNGSAWTPIIKYTGPFYLTGPDGEWQILYYSVDNFGKKENNGTKTVYLDNTAPLVDATYPANGRNEIPVNTTFSLKFSEPIMGDFNFTITPDIGCSFNFSWDDNHTTCQIIPINGTLEISTTYIITIFNAYDFAGNKMPDYTFSFETPHDSDGDGIPDSNDTFPDDPAEWQDSDEDGVGDNADAFPDDATEWLDTDGDGTGDNADTDDDGDGFLDSWEDFLGTDPLDPNDMPVDTDSDGIPDGDAANSEPWMDADDDGDGVLDADENPPPEEPGFIGQYWWLIVLVTIVAVVGLVLAMRRKPGKPEEPPGEP